ncbi:MAG: GDYXXLXY domain-containing protein, partial [Gammaproteobacteria bacterium]|nr:GDYXXLXY domain-containing protein [Gammaproteobacteria bacterium]
MAADIASHSRQLTDEGQVVVTVDERNVAQFQRIHDGAAPLNANEHLLLYRKRNGVVKIASDAFYFQEQHGKYYTTARYGEVRVSSNGDAVLTGLRDDQFTKLTAVATQG